MATIAVFLALGGVATAAFTLPKKSVGAKNLKKDAVTNPKVADAAIGTAELGSGAVTAGKLGDASVTAAKLAAGAAFKNVVVREVVFPNQANSAADDSEIQCNPGEVAIGGGGGGTTPGTRNFPNNDADTQVLSISPIDSGDQAVANGQTPTGMHISIKNGTAGNRDLRVWAFCAQK